MSHQRILILDFGSQVTQLIARRVREAGVYSEVHPNDVSAEFVRDFAPQGVILSGSHASTYEAQELRTRTEFVEITAAGIRESHVHDVQIVKEAPNYRVE